MLFGYQEMIIYFFPFKPLRIFPLIALLFCLSLMTLNLSKSVRLALFCLLSIFLAKTESLNFSSSL